MHVYLQAFMWMCVCIACLNVLVCVIVPLWSLKIEMRIIS
jgi:hypothetical protein